MKAQPKLTCRLTIEGSAVRLVTEPYSEQVKVWPKQGRHILAQYDDDTIVVYQAYRAFFDTLLAEAVPSFWDGDQFATKDEWSRAVERSSVRLQWDPDHLPSGASAGRRAIQLGLRGKVLEAFGRRELVEVIDLSEFVAEQRSRLSSGGVDVPMTPRERVYRPADPAVAERLRLEDERLP